MGSRQQIDGQADAGHHHRIGSGIAALAQQAEGLAAPAMTVVGRGGAQR